ncbi:hypothetical protein LY76DRAFT_131234 [Colletotrichum caudatum]|nr:hypothetical protein LY76DRAFT_131234 [Colletotrichum caudatum]
MSWSDRMPSSISIFAAMRRRGGYDQQYPIGPLRLCRYDRHRVKMKTKKEEEEEKEEEQCEPPSCGRVGINKQPANLPRKEPCRPRYAQLRYPARFILVPASGTATLAFLRLASMPWAGREYLTVCRVLQRKHVSPPALLHHHYHHHHHHHATTPHHPHARTHAHTHPPGGNVPAPTNRAGSRTRGPAALLSGLGTCFSRDCCRDARCIRTGVRWT